MTTQEPLVSILMPYYCAGEFLKEAVASVRAQTYTNWELLIVDDSSPQEPAREVIAASGDAQIRIFRHEENRGIAAARNTAAANSKGALYLPFDADDLLAPTYIERIVKAMLDAGAWGAYSDVQIFGAHSYVYEPSADLGTIFSGHFPHNTFIYKKELFDAVGGYKKFGYVEDTEFWVSVLELGKPFVHVPEPLYLYRRHRESTTQRMKSHLYADFRRILREHHHSLVENLPTLLNCWLKQEEERARLAEEACRMEEQYIHLHQEFHSLLERYQSLEKQRTATEDTLSSMPKLARQLAYLGLKKVKMR